MLFRHTDFFVQRGDRVALIGPNGSGKTTLLQLLLRQLEPTEGTVYRAPVSISYVTQELEHLNPTNTVLEEATGGNRAPDQAYARTLLGCLLFSGDAVYKKVGVLSGGEKVRLAIAKILLGFPDLLVLDEPTNGLDIPSRERIEDALDSYSGTLIVVSHDRYLLKRLANRVFALEGGQLETFSGNYDEFQQRKNKAEKTDTASQRLLLETRLAKLSAALADPPPDEKEQLTKEFIKISRELQALR
jgi:ATPase subunit of ABC transporter with duplicated ATPase domains